MYSYIQDEVTLEGLSNLLVNDSTETVILNDNKLDSKKEGSIFKLAGLIQSWEVTKLDSKDIRSSFQVAIHYEENITNTIYDSYWSKGAVLQRFKFFESKIWDLSIENKLTLF